MNFCKYIFFMLLFFCMEGKAQQPFTAGNIVVYRLGDGVTALDGSATTIYLDEFSPSGTLIQSIAMPTTGNRITMGTVNNGGAITISPNGKYLGVTGFNVAPGTNLNLPQPRSVGFVDFNGKVTSVTTFPSSAQLNALYSAITDDGNRFWYASADGIGYTTVGVSPGATLFSSPILSPNVLSIDGGQLYASNGGAPALVKVGTGLPVSGTQTLTALPGLNTPTDDHIRQFAFADLNPAIAGNDVLYIASQSSNVGGIQKYSLVGGTWILNGTIGTSADRYGGLAVQVTGNNVSVYGTRRGANSLSIRGGDLIKVTDNSGYNGTFTGTPVILSTASPANSKAYRGITVVPQPAPFTAGNFVVYRMGDGVTVFDGSSNAIFLDEYSPSGTLVQSVMMPVSGTKLTMGTVNNGGELSLSPNGKYIAVTGFNVAPGGNLNIPQLRSIGIVDFKAQVNSVTSFPGSAQLNAFYTAVTDDGNRIWYAGPDGISYTTAGATTSTTLFQSNIITHNSLAIEGGQLYVSNTLSPALTKVGTGLPVTSGQALTGIPGLNGASDDHIRQFAFADLSAAIPGNDVLYIASQSSNVGGIQKYSLDASGNWVLNGTVGTSADRYSGLAIKASGGSVTILATRRGGNSLSIRGGDLVRMTDASGYNGAFAPTPVVIATATTANTLTFRGVVPVPQGCPQVKSLSALNVTSSQATISWQAPDGGASNYEHAVTTSATPPASGTATANLTQTITGLANNTTYYVYARTVCSPTSSSEWASTSFVTSCKAPALPQVVVTATRSGAVTFSWAKVFGAASYEYLISTSATPPVSGTITTDTAVTSNSLAAVTKYYIHVRSNCGGGAFSPWTSKEYTTACFAPAPAVVITAGNAAVKWNRVNNAARYEYALTSSVAFPFTGTYTPDTSYTTSNVADGKAYFYHVRTGCANGAVSEWSTVSFHAIGLDVYPNPVRDVLQIRLQGISNPNATVVIADGTGKVVTSVKLTGNAASVNTSGWATGIYTLRYSDGQQSYSVRIVKR